MFNDEPVQLLTPGRIATRLKVPVHRVLYVIRSRRHIQPAARAGNNWVYDEQAKAQIRYELNKIDARRCRRRAEVS